MLKTLDLTRALPEKEYWVSLKSNQLELREQCQRLWKENRSAIVVFEGWDAAGKGGAIKRLAETLDPRGFNVSSFSAPKGDEKEHHYLWRFWKSLPNAGQLAIFDRSHYGRVLVERVEKFCTEAQWRRAFHEINEFEWQITSFGTVVVKFWMHISQEEQLRRFQERELDPFRSYKLTEEDWRNRSKWGEYEIAVEDMLRRTSTLWAPWTVVEANDKFYARVKVVETVVRALKAANK